MNIEATTNSKCSANQNMPMVAYSKETLIKEWYETKKRIRKMIKLNNKR